MNPGVKINFEFNSKRGATLITDHTTYKEDMERMGNAEKYIRKHHKSWVYLAEERGDGDVRPVLVTGVDLTKRFASMARSDGDTRLGCAFSVGPPVGGSGSLGVWGSWSSEDPLVHTNCGPPTPPERGNQSPSDSPSEGPSLELIPPADHNQCVFIRYYTMRWKFFVLKAMAGPHQLPDGDTGNYDDDTGAVAVETSNFDDDSTQDASLNVTQNAPPVSPNNTIVCRCSQNLSRMTATASTLLQNSYFRSELRYKHRCFRVTPRQRTKATSLLLRDSDIPEHTDVRLLVVSLTMSLTFVQGSETEIIQLLEESRIIERVEVDEDGGKLRFYEPISKVSYFSVGKLVPMTHLDGDEVLNPVQEDNDVTVSSHLCKGAGSVKGTAGPHR